MLCCGRGVAGGGELVIEIGVTLGGGLVLSLGLASSTPSATACRVVVGFDLACAMRSQCTPTPSSRHMTFEILIPLAFRSLSCCARKALRAVLRLPGSRCAKQSGIWSGLSFC